MHCALPRRVPVTNRSALTAPGYRLYAFEQLPVFYRCRSANGLLVVTLETISGAQSMLGLGERVAACLAPWREFAATAVRDVLAASPVAQLLPAEEAAHAVVAGILDLGGARKMEAR